MAHEIHFFQLGKTKFHKSHHFDKCNDVPMMVGEARPGIGGERLPFQKLPPANSNIPRGSGPDLPSWVAFDRQVQYRMLRLIISKCFDFLFESLFPGIPHYKFFIVHCFFFFFFFF